MKTQNYQLNFSPVTGEVGSVVEVRVDSPVCFACVEWRVPDGGRDHDTGEFYNVVHAFARTTASSGTVGPPWRASSRTVSLCGDFTFVSSGARPTSTWCATCEAYAESFKRLVRDYAEARDREIDRAWAA